MLFSSRSALRCLLATQAQLGITAPHAVRLLATPAKTWFSEVEKENAKVLEAVSAKVAQFRAAQQVRAFPCYFSSNV